MPTIRPLIRAPYMRERVTYDLTGQEDRTDRSFGNDTDINKIVARFTRHPEEMPEAGGQYADVTSLQDDLSTLINKSREAMQEYRAAEAALEAKQAEMIAANAEKAAELERMLQERAAAEPPTEG